MRPVVRWALTAAAVALLPLGAWAQGTQFFAQPFQYSDANGVGTLTVTPLNNLSTRLIYQPVKVTLVQNGVYSVGSGVYHAFTDDNANLPPFALLSFALVGPNGSSQFYQATLAAVNGFAGDGTAYPVTSPQTVITWHVQSMPATTSILNNSPVLHSGWYTNSFAEAIGGSYYSTFNTFQGMDSTATWSGSVPSPGNYRIEVFIPRQPGPGSAPRTNHAVYQVFLGGFVGVGYGVVNQQVATSQWITLGTYSLAQSSYQVMLIDQTGEPQQTRSVVADAIRLTRVQ